MEHFDPPALHLLAMYLSPYALPHERVKLGADWRTRVRVHRNNMLKLRPYLREYIFRSAQLIIVFFAASILFSLILPLPILGITAIAITLAAVAHTVFLIFLQQEANNVAAAQGLKNSEIDEDR